MTADEIRHLTDKELTAILDKTNVNDPTRILYVEEQNRRDDNRRHRQILWITLITAVVCVATFLWSVLYAPKR
jgi:hypothetical protein